MTWAPRQACAGVEDMTAPSSPRGAASSGSRFHTRSPRPALEILAAIAAPMVPVPSTATTGSLGTCVLADPHGFSVHELAHAQVGQFTPVTAEFHSAEGDFGVAGGLPVEQGETPQNDTRDDNYA